MDPFSYLSVLISIILALGMTRVLAGVGEMLQARSRRQIYWVHAVWIVNLFINLIIAWWVFYRWRYQQEWTFFLFVFVLISPTVLYLASLLLFPREGSIDESVNYKTHFYANHRAFFIVLALYGPVDLIDTLLKGIPHFLKLRPSYVVSLIIFLTWPNDCRQYAQRALSSDLRHILFEPDRFHQFRAFSHPGVK